MDRGARSSVTNISQRIGPMLLQEIFQTPFSKIIIKRKEKPTGRRHARNTHVTQTGSSRIFKRINQKRSIGNLSLYLSDNSFASFLSQTSNLVHSSLHLSTWSPRFNSHDLLSVSWPIELNVRFILVLRR